MKHHEGEDNVTSATAVQQLVDEHKTPMDSKSALKRKASSSKKIYIHNYFTRARSGAGEGDKEGDPIAPVDDPAPQAPQSLATLPSLILEHDSLPRLTRTEHKREYGLEQEQEPDSISSATSFGTGSSIFEELVALADTAPEQCWNSPRVKTMIKTTKTHLVGEPKEAFCTWRVPNTSLRHPDQHKD
ncbi:hypothetical protein NDU88_002279 [Pleurodeles waltl]|uniref:Uncharacterized protein n=1 Tax=Pleurodeles waltl TaxID=8319 RepID=A0AAV7T332_PLEWA|nr:hypothetical protein NDU88_002279 [Pleurodeles waltl]